MPLATSPLIQSLSDIYSQSSFENSSKNWQQEVENIIYSHNQDNVFLWTRDWITLSSDLVRILLNSGLKLPVTIVNNVIDESTIKSSLTKNKQTGITKVNKLDFYFQLIIHALSSLLSRGCESGPVSISLDFILSVLTTVMSLNIRADSNTNANAKVSNLID